MAKRYFINNLNTYIGQALFKEFWSDDPENDDQNIILGTFIDKDDTEMPKGVKKMLKRSKPRLAKKYIAESDIIIYSIHNGNPEDIQAGIEALRKAPEDEEKTFILISSVVGWNKTPPKMKPLHDKEEAKGEGEEGAEGGEGEGGEEGEGEGAGAVEKSELKEESKDLGEDSKIEEDVDRSKIEGDTNTKEDVEEEEIEMVHNPFEEADYKLRVPSEDVEFIKKYEDLVLSIKRENIKCYVIAAGILYGIGETVFQEHLKCGWLQNPKRLPYIGNGDNLVPTIHVKDLARLVKKVALSRPENNYIFGIDRTQNSSQRNIIEAISKGVGTGETGRYAQVQEPDPFYNEIKCDYNKYTMEEGNWKTILSLDLKMKVSELLMGTVDEDGNEDEGDFEWHCKKGIAANIDKIADEYCKVVGLKPFKIFINGPPFAGKTYFSAKIAEHYNIMHITQEKAVKLVEDIDPLFDDLADDLQDWRRDNQNSNYPDSLIVQCYKYALRQNACKFRGYILEGFPQSYTDAKDLFITIPRKKKKRVPPPPPPPPELSEEEKKEIEEEERKKKEGEKVLDKSLLDKSGVSGEGGEGEGEGEAEGEEPKEEPPPDQKEVEDVVEEEKEEGEGVEGEEGEGEGEEVPPSKPKFEQELFPDSVIILSAQQSTLLNRFNMSEPAKKRRKYPQTGEITKEEFVEKVDSYNSLNNIEICDINQQGFTLKNYFQEKGVEIQEIDSEKNPVEILEEMRIYIERFGRPYNFLASTTQINLQRLQYLEKLEVEEKDKLKNQIEIDKQATGKGTIELETKMRKRMEMVMKHEEELDKSRQQNTRKFLMDNIIPVLTEGMVDLCRVVPVDPVDFLSEYLLKKSNQLH